MSLLGVPVEFLLFAVTLIGIAVLHARALEIALAGLLVVVALKVALGGFEEGPGAEGLAAHLAHEWPLLANLALLLLGFALLASQFERSNLPEAIPRFLPHGWPGGFVLLVLV